MPYSQVLHFETGGELVAEDAFAVVGLFNILNMPLAVFPQAVRSLSEVAIGMKRLKQLLLMYAIFSNLYQSSLVHARCFVILCYSLLFSGILWYSFPHFRFHDVVSVPGCCPRIHKNTVQ